MLKQFKVVVYVCYPASAKCSPLASTNSLPGVHKYTQTYMGQNMDMEIYKKIKNNNRKIK